MTNYKGFEITPSPHQLAETGEWSLQVTITRHHDARNETLEKQYSAHNTFPTLDEAKENACEFGKQIIDGHYPDLSVNCLL